MGKLETDAPKANWGGFERLAATVPSGCFVEWPSPKLAALGRRLFEAEFRPRELRRVGTH